MENYVVATIKDWNIDQFNKKTTNLTGQWHLITQPEELTLEKLEKIKPKYVFFPHWSWLVPTYILRKFTCICFHMTDVPYGRGGSPLQNLILREHKSTKLSALKMEEKLDSGPIYLQVPLSLKGSAQEIFVDCAEKVFDLISTIIKLDPVPVPQTGEVLIFSRRTASQSQLPESISVAKSYDFIRMLDAETYHKAFINYGDLLLEFSNANLNSPHELTAQVKITVRENKHHEE
jgi:methionyl-tRNA formyltransferase